MNGSVARANCRIGIAGPPFVTLVTLSTFWINWPWPGTPNNQLKMDGNGETTIFHVKLLHHPIDRTIYKWMFQVPGVTMIFSQDTWAVLKRSFISQGRKESLTPPPTHHLRSHSASLRVEIPVFCLRASLRWLTHLRVLLTRTFLWPPPVLLHKGGGYSVAHLTKTYLKCCTSIQPITDAFIFIHQKSEDEAIGASLAIPR